MIFHDSSRRSSWPLNTGMSMSVDGGSFPLHISLQGRGTLDNTVYVFPVSTIWTWSAVFGKQSMPPPACCLSFQAVRTPSPPPPQAAERSGSHVQAPLEKKCRPETPSLSVLGWIIVSEAGFSWCQCFSQWWSKSAAKKATTPWWARSSEPAVKDYLATWWQHKKPRTQPLNAGTENVFTDPAGLFTCIRTRAFEHKITVNTIFSRGSVSGSTNTSRNVGLFSYQMLHLAVSDVISLKHHS